MPRQLSAEELQEVYRWVDTIPLSRIKRNIARDFSDGVLLSEIVHHTFPKLVDLHNFSSSNSVKQKVYNWQTMNRKVLRKIGFQLTKEEIEDVVHCKRGAVEAILNTCQTNFEEYKQKRDERRNLHAAISHGTRHPHSSPSSAPRGTRRTHKSPEQRTPNRPKSEQHAQEWNPVQNAGEAQFPPDIRTILTEKDRQIRHMSDKLEIMELKVQKLEQLLRLKDSKIEVLKSKLSRME